MACSRSTISQVILVKATPANDIIYMLKTDTGHTEI